MDVEWTLNGNRMGMGGPLNGLFFFTPTVRLWYGMDYANHMEMEQNNSVCPPGSHMMKGAALRVY